MPVKKTCKDCGRAFKVPPCRAKTARYCSIKCAAPHRMEGLGKSLMLICPACKNEFKVPRSHVHRRKFCSKKCRDGDLEYRWEKSQRSRGARNAQWKGGRVRHTDGYVYVSAPGHPFASNGYVLEHRLVMEQWLRENDPESPFLIRVLSSDFVVHHEDGNRQNNAIDNLSCMTLSEHTKHHNAERDERTA